MDSYSFKIEAVSKEHAAFVTLKKLVSETYWENYNATINPEPDYFVAVRDNESNWLGCFGVTLAEHRPLFSERYLGHPVEALLQDMLGVLPMRSVIAECGAFASPKVPGIGKILVGAMPWILASFGIHYVLVTITPQVKFLFKKLNIPFAECKLASVDSLAEFERHLWGSYYDYKPVTGIVSIRDGVMSSIEHRAGRYPITSMLAERNLVTAGVR